MKRCPECRRDYYDDSMLYCLDDGAALLEGPASGNEPVTAILHAAEPPSEAATKAQVHLTEPADGPSSILVPAAKAFDKRLILGPLLVAAIILAGFLAYRYATQVRQIESIAVMPFVNESGNADVDYLSDGMTETLINSLSQVPNLKVTSRNSVFRYKGKDADTNRVGSELNVRALVTGRVKQIGDHLIINVSLEDTQDNHQIWGEQYDRKQADLISLQSDIARDVSGKLKAKLSGADEQRVTKTYTTNPEAYQLYLQGLFHWNKREPEELRKSIVLFQQATEKDPSYAQAFAGLALAYGVLGANTVPTKQELAEIRLKERAALRRAQELDDLAEVHADLAGIKNDIDWDFAGAETEHKRAIELNPNFATARQWYSEFLSTMGRRDEAWEQINKAHETDPFSRAINGNIGLRLFEARRTDEAIAQYKKVIEMEPTYPVVHSFLSLAYEAKGMYPEAIAEMRTADILLEKESTANADVKAAAYTRAFQAGGARGYFQKRLEFDLKEYEKGYQSAFEVARIYSRLGEKDRAFEYLDKSLSAHEEDLVYIKAEPALDGIGSDPRFADLLRRIGLPE